MGNEASRDVPSKFSDATLAEFNKRMDAMITTTEVFNQAVGEVLTRTKDLQLYLKAVNHEEGLNLSEEQKCWKNFADEALCYLASVEDVLSNSQSQNLNTIWKLCTRERTKEMFGTLTAESHNLQNNCNRGSDPAIHYLPPNNSFLQKRILCLEKRMHTFIDQEQLHKQCVLNLSQQIEYLEQQLCTNEENLLQVKLSQNEKVSAEKLSSLESELESLRKLVNDNEITSKNHLEEKNNLLEKSNQELKSMNGENENLKRTISSLETDLNNIRSQVTQMQILEKTTDELQSKLQELVNINSQLKEQCVECKTTCDRAYSEIVKKDEHIQNEFHKSIEHLQKSAQENDKTISAQKDVFEKINSELKSKIKEIEKEHSDLKQDMEQKYIQVCRERDDLILKENALTIKIEMSENQFSERNAQLEWEKHRTQQLEDKILKHERSIDELNKKLEKQREVHEEAVLECTREKDKTISEHVNVIKIAKTELENLKQKDRNFKSSIKELEKSGKETLHKLLDKEKECSQLKTQTIELLTQLQTLTDQSKTEKKTAMEKYEALRAKCNQEKDELKSSSSKSIENAQEKIKILEFDNKSKEDTIQKQEKEMSIFQEKCKLMDKNLLEKDDEICNLVEQIQKYQKENSELINRITEKDSLLTKIEKENLGIEDKLNKTLQQLDLQFQKNQEQSQKFKDLNSEAEDLKTALSQKETALKEVRTEKEHILKENQESQRKLIGLSKNLNDLQSKNDELTTKIESISLTSRRIEADALSERERFEKQIDLLRKNVEEEKIKSGATKLKIIKVEEAKVKSENEIADLKQEISRLKAIKTLKVQMYSSCRVEMLSTLEEDLKLLLKSKMETNNRQLEFIPCARQSDIEPGIPVLLICIAASRLGTDVTNVLQGITPTNKMALLIFHHKDEHALPSQASERVLTGNEIKDLGRIFDMAFLSGKGIYNCLLNNNNVASLVNFIGKESSEVAHY